MHGNLDPAIYLRDSAWWLAVELLGENRQAVLGRSLEIQDYLYFCWRVTRPWRIIRRIIAAILSMRLSDEFRLIRLQRQVMRHALQVPLNLPGFIEAVATELAARSEYRIGSSASPAAANILRGDGREPAQVKSLTRPYPDPDPRARSSRQSSNLITVIGGTPPRH